MPFAEQALNSLARIVRNLAQNELQRKQLIDSLSIDSIILYGSSAKYHLNQTDHFGDFDLNVFFRRKEGYRKRDARKFNKRGGYWSADDFQGKRVQVMFNVLSNGEDWQDSAQHRKSERWQRICRNAIIQIYPAIVAHPRL